MKTPASSIGFLAFVLLRAAAAMPQELTPEELYKKVAPSVITLHVEKNDGTKVVGTAFLALKDGIAVTAWHVVAGAQQVMASSLSDFLNIFVGGELQPLIMAA